MLLLWLVTAVCLHIQTVLAYDTVLERCIWDPGKSWNFLYPREWEPWMNVISQVSTAAVSTATSGGKEGGSGRQREGMQ